MPVLLHAQAEGRRRLYPPLTLWCSDVGAARGARDQDCAHCRLCPHFDPGLASLKQKITEKNEDFGFRAANREDVQLHELQPQG